MSLWGIENEMRIPATDRPSSGYLERAALLSASATVLIGIMGILGWLLQQPALTSFEPNYIPIALSTCIAFLIQGSILILRSFSPKHVRRWPFGAVVAVTPLFGLLAFIGYLSNSGLDFEWVLSPSTEHFAQFPANRMSPLTGMLFCFSGASLLVSLWNNPGKPAPDMASVLAVPPALTGFIGTMSYLYGTPLLYVGPVIPMALSTCAAFMALGFGLIAVAGPGTFLLRPFTGSSIRAMLLRIFVPLGFLAVIGSDILQRAVTSLNSALVSTISAVFWVTVTVVLIAQAARMIGRIIDKAEAERALSENKLLQAKQDWERTFDSVPDLIAIMDQQHRIMRVNKAMADRLGLTPEQCIGASCYKVVHGLTGAPAFCPHVLSCKDGCEHVTEIYEPRLGGHFQISTTPLWGEQDQIVGAVHVARDVTLRKKGEEALRKAHDRLDAIVEFLPDATFVIEVSGRVIAWNRAMELMTGISKADMLQMADHEYAVPFYGEKRPVLIDLLLKPDPEFESSKYNNIQRHGDLLYGETFAPRVI